MAELVDILEQDWRWATHATVRQLQCLVGCLNRISQVIFDGKKFLNRILPFLRGQVVPSHKFEITNQFKLDLRWWHHTAPKINNRALMSVPVSELNALCVVDGRSRLGNGEPPMIGGLNRVRKEMFSRLVPEEFNFSHVHIIKMVAFVVGARLWCESTYKGVRAVLESDNQAVVDVLTDGQGKTKDPYLQAWARIIWNLNADHGSSLAVRYVNTKLNESDGLSRGKINEIESLRKQGFTMIDVSNDVCNLHENY